jgi:hypothetical protein
MKNAIPEKNKRAGICYAFSEDGLELPVIDITQPAFFVTRPGEEELSALMQKAAAEQEKFNRLPAFVRNAFLLLFSRRSVIMRGIRASSGTFLSGMNTYLMKLGPDNLGAGYAGKTDKAIASSMPALSVRLRLQAVARMLADGIAPVLASRPQEPVHFINLAGGPCLDSLNALILLRREKPGLLDGRRITIYALDLEMSGPEFGKRALEALRGPGSPLQGVAVTLEYVPYDWSEPQRLRDFLAARELKNTVVAASSEGGLFDYGTDLQVSGNLQALHAGIPPDAPLIGSITPDQGLGKIFNATSGARTVPRALADFAALVRESGWVVAENLELPLNQVLGLRKT